MNQQLDELLRYFAAAAEQPVVEQPGDELIGHFEAAAEQPGDAAEHQDDVEQPGTPPRDNP